MLQITIPEKEVYDTEKNLFYIVGPTKLQLEHSLLSISKWEAKWKKPFLTKNEKTNTELIDYVKCMTINPNVPDICYYGLTSELINEIADYIYENRSATTFSDARKDGAPRGREHVYTSEELYYYMAALQIPFEAQKWHLSRLLTLLKIASIKNQDPNKKKMSKNEILTNNAALNKARRESLKSKG